jgi:hypothetical protein
MSRMRTGAPAEATARRARWVRARPAAQAVCRSRTPTPETHCAGAPPCSVASHPTRVAGCCSHRPCLPSPCLRSIPPPVSRASRAPRTAASRSGQKAPSAGGSAVCHAVSCDTRLLTASSETSVTTAAGGGAPRRRAQSSYIPIPCRTDVHGRHGRAACAHLPRDPRIGRCRHAPRRARDARRYSQPRADRIGLPNHPGDEVQGWPPAVESQCAVRPAPPVVALCCELCRSHVP